MIIWLTGNTGAGKTTLARNMAKAAAENTIILDGDEMRETISCDLTLSNDDRHRHNFRVARLARNLHQQGFQVIVALICPFENLRTEVQEITGCSFIYVSYEGDDQNPDAPYERPSNPTMTITRGCINE